MWTSEITVEFVPLPKEKEEAYWAAIHYFAELLYLELTAPLAEVEAVSPYGSSGVLH